MKLDKFIEKYGNENVDEKELKELLGIKVEKYFIPKEDEYYFVVNMLGEVYQGLNSSDVGAERTRYNEVFKTTEEAEEHAKKKRFLLQMKRDFLDNSDEIDWENDDQEKFFLTYDHFDETTKIYSNWAHQELSFFTTNREWLEQYLKEHEEEIKKYYFEVEEKESSND